MSKEDVRKPIREKYSSFKEKDDQKPNYKLLSKHLKKVYPDRLYNASASPLSLSSLSLSLSQNSSDSTDSSTTLNQKFSAAIHLIAPREKREFSTVARYMQKLSPGPTTDEGLNRCNSEVTESRSHQQGLIEERLSICWTCDCVLIHASCRDDH